MSRESTYLAEDDDPPCWDLAPGGGARCGLDVGHEDEHRYTIWTLPESERGAV